MMMTSRMTNMALLARVARLESLLRKSVLSLTRESKEDERVNVIVDEL